jgi:alkylated DNA repair dioxygenase AlkB
VAQFPRYAAQRSQRARSYRSGADHIGYHADKTRDIRDGTSVITPSFGAVRRFRLRPKEGNGATIEIPLARGSVFVLGAETNQLYKHSIVKEANVNVGARYSVTLRTISTIYDPSTDTIIENGAA